VEHAFVQCMYTMNGTVQSWTNFTTGNIYTMPHTCEVISENLNMSSITLSYDGITEDDITTLGLWDNFRIVKVGIIDPNTIVDTSKFADDLRRDNIFHNPQKTATEEGAKIAKKALIEYKYLSIAGCFVPFILIAIIGGIWYHFYRHNRQVVGEVNIPMKDLPRRALIGTSTGEGTASAGASPSPAGNVSSNSGTGGDTTKVGVAPGTAAKKEVGGGHSSTFGLNTVGEGTVTDQPVADSIPGLDVESSTHVKVERVSDPLTLRTIHEALNHAN